MRLEDVYLQSLADQFEIDQGPEAMPAEFQQTDGVSPGEFMRGALDTAAIGTKGMVQGSVGLPGDLEGLLRTVGNALGFQIDENTVLPTTEEVRAFFDKYVPIKPEQTPTMGDGERKAVEQMAEIVSPAGPIAGAKAVAKTVRKVRKPGAAVAAGAAKAAGDKETK